MAELAQGMRLDLPDPLTGQAELVADLFERPRTPVVEAESEAEDVLLAAFEAIERSRQLLLEQLIGDRVERRDGIRVLDEAP